MQDIIHLCSDKNLPSYISHISPRKRFWLARIYLTCISYLSCSKARLSFVYSGRLIKHVYEGLCQIIKTLEISRWWRLCVIIRGLPTFFHIFPLAMETSEFSERKTISRVGLCLCTSLQVSPLAIYLASSPDLLMLSPFSALARDFLGLFVQPRHLPVCTAHVTPERCKSFMLLPGQQCSSQLLPTVKQQQHRQSINSLSCLCQTWRPGLCICAVVLVHSGLYWPWDSSIPFPCSTQHQ